MLSHQIKKLGMNFSCFADALSVKKVLGAPLRVKSILLCSHIHVEKGQVITFWDKEFFSCCVAFLRTILWPEEDAGDAQHAHDR